MPRGRRGVRGVGGVAGRAGVVRAARRRAGVGPARARRAPAPARAPRAHQVRRALAPGGLLRHRSCRWGYQGVLLDHSPTIIHVRGRTCQKFLLQAHWPGCYANTYRQCWPSILVRRGRHHESAEATRARLAAAPSTAVLSLCDCDARMARRRREHNVVRRTASSLTALVMYLFIVVAIQMLRV